MSSVNAVRVDVVRVVFRGAGVLGWGTPQTFPRKLQVTPHENDPDSECMS